MRALLASLLFLVLAAGFAAAAPLQILANDSIAEQTTTSSTQVPAANITFTPQGGNNNRCYLLMASGEVSQSNANNEVRVNFTVDSLTIGTSNFEPQSTASYYSVAFHNVTCFADQNAHDATLYFSRDATTAAIRNARVIALGINNSADYIANFTIPKTLTTGNVYRPYLNLTFTVPSSGTHNYLLLGSLEFDHGATAVASSIIVRFQLDNVVIAESNFSGQSGNAVGAFTFMAHNVSTLSAGSHKLNISVMQAGGTAGLIRRVRLTVVNLTGYSYAANESVPVKKDTAASYLPVTSVSMPFIFNKDFIALASSVASTSATSARVRNILFPPYDLAPSWRTTVDVAIANENFSFFALWNDTWDSASEPEHLMNLSHGSEDGSTEIRTGHASISVIWVPLSCGTLTASTTLDIDLTTTGTCFTIGADSITLDCNGHTITGSGSTAGSGFGVMNTQYDNVVIRNCVITNFEKGIYFTGASDNAIFINDTISAVTEGVYVNISSTPRMWNLSITSPSRAGILLNRSNWGGIFNTTVDSTSVLPLTELYDIYLYMSNFSFIHNVTVATSQFLAQSYGIALESSNTTTISNYSSPQSETGLYIFLSNMTRVENSSLDQFSAYGIFLSSSNNSFIRNVTLNNGSIGPVLSGTGIYLSGSWFNLFQNLSVWNNSGPGATISLSNNNSFENSSFRRNAWSVAGGSGVSLSSSSNNTFWNITVEDQSGATGNTGIDLISSSNDNRFLNVTSRNNSAGFNFTASDRNLIVNSTAANNSYGVYFSKGSDNNYIVNSSFLPAGMYGAYATDELVADNLNNTFLNSTFGIWNATALGGSYIRVQWYARILAKNYAELAIEGAFFNISNNSALIATDLSTGTQAINLTEASGYSNWTIIEGQIITAGSVFQAGNHTFNASKGAISNFTNYTVNESKDYVVYLNFVIVNCGTLTGSTTMANDLATTGTCFTIGANDIYLDCAGYTIQGPGANDTFTVGILNDGYDGVLIQNCKILNFETGIHWTGGANNGRFYNDTIFNNSAFGMLINSSSNYNIINLTNVTMTSANLSHQPSSFRDADLGAVTINGSVGTIINNSNFTAGVNVSRAPGKPQGNAQSALAILKGSHNTTVENASLMWEFIRTPATAPSTALFSRSLPALWINESSNITIRDTAIYQNSSVSKPCTAVDCYDFIPAKPALWISAAANVSISRITLFSEGDTWIAAGGFGNDAVLPEGRAIYIINSQNIDLTDSNITSGFITSGYNGNTGYTALELEGTLNVTVNNTNLTLVGNSSAVLLRSYTNFTMMANSSVRTVNGISPYGDVAVSFAGASSNNTVMNSNLTADQYHVNASGSSMNNTLYNTTFDQYNTSFAADGSYVRVWWNARINVTDYGNNPVEGAFFNISNGSAMIATDPATGSQAINLTEATGYSNWTAIEDAIITSAGVFTIGNHTFNASKTGYQKNWTNSSINYSQTVTVYLKTASAVDISFTVTLPGPSTNASSNYTPPLNVNYTADIEFNATNRSAAWLNASVSPCCGANQQDAATPIFVYTNTGNTPINISLWFDGTTMPPGVNVTASNNSPASLGSLLATGGIGCAYQSDVTNNLDSEPGDGNGAVPLSCKNLTTAGARSRFVTNIPTSASRNLWVWAFYDNIQVAAGSVDTGAYTRNITHGSGQASP